MQQANTRLEYTWPKHQLVCHVQLAHSLSSLKVQLTPPVVFRVLLERTQPLLAVQIRQNAKHVEQEPISQLLQQQMHLPACRALQANIRRQLVQHIKQCALRVLLAHTCLSLEPPVQPHVFNVVRERTLRL